jgi:thiol-disulfide isomerase/thioredoxin
MLRRFFCTFLFIFLLFLPQPVIAQESPELSPPSEVLEEGTYVPAFALMDFSGNSVDISGYLGRSPILLCFWSIYCDSVINDMIALQELEDKYRGQGLVTLAINGDIRAPTDRVQRYLERLENSRGKLSFPVLFDQELRIFNDFRISDTPTLVLIDGDGRIAGYFSGFNPSSKSDFFRIIEKTVTGEEHNGSSKIPPAERSEIITVTGEASLCGFYESGTWRKGFTGNDSLHQEMDLTLEIARRDALRSALISALRKFDIVLFSDPPIRDCVNSVGIHIARDPFDTSDPVSNLIAKINNSYLLEPVEEQEILINTTYYSTMKFRFYPDRLASELESLAYLNKTHKVSITYVNVNPLAHKKLLRSLLGQSMYIGSYENPLFASHLTSQIFEVYTTSRTFADEIMGMDFGETKVFVEEVTDTSLELEVWK